MPEDISKRKVRTDLTGRHDITTEEIIKGLTPPSDVSPSDKARKVMHEYKQGTLKSSDGKQVKSRKRALAIALSEAGLSKKD